MRAQLANRVWIASARSEARRFAAALAAPEAAQLRLLGQYVRSASDSRFGLEHRLDGVHGVDAFRERVPIRDYDEIAPWIDRIRNGERRVLGRAAVRSFVPSSGSTAARKLIPYTTELLTEFGRAVRAWIVDLFEARPELTRGPAYWALSPAIHMPDLRQSAVPCRFEDDSAYLGRLGSPLTSAVLAVPDAVRHLHDTESFRYGTLLFLLRQRELRLISVWHPSFLTLLLELLARRWDDLLGDIAQGTLTPPGPIEPSIHAALERRLRPDAERASELRAIGPVSLGRIWPGLGLISCWADANARPAAEELKRRSDGIEMQPKGLMATEAVVSLPFAGGRPLAVRSHFFEFVDDGGRPRLAHELKDGGEYAVVVSTGGGLLRYRLGDRVRVDGFVGGTPSIRFVGRNDRVSDQCGEKLSDGHVAAVLERLLEPLVPDLAFAMLAPDSVGDRPGYTLYLESGVDLPEDLPHRLDRELARNPHYRYCRDLGQLERPRIFRIMRGAQRAYIDAFHRSGHGLGQIKPAALGTETDWTRLFDGGYVARANPRTRARATPSP